MISDKTEASRLISAFVSKDHTILYGSELGEVRSKTVELKIVRQAPNKDLTQLSVDLITARARVLP